MNEPTPNALEALRRAGATYLRLLAVMRPAPGPDVRLSPLDLDENMRAIDELLDGLDLVSVAGADYTRLLQRLHALLTVTTMFGWVAVQEIERRGGPARLDFMRDFERKLEAFLETAGDAGP